MDVVRYILFKLLRNARLLGPWWNNATCLPCIKTGGILGQLITFTNSRTRIWINHFHSPIHVRTTNSVQFNKFFRPHCSVSLCVCLRLFSAFMYRFCTTSYTCLSDLLTIFLYSNHSLNLFFTTYLRELPG